MSLLRVASFLLIASALTGCAASELETSTTEVRAARLAPSTLSGAEFVLRRDIEATTASIWAAVADATPDGLTCYVTADSRLTAGTALHTSSVSMLFTARAGVPGKQPVHWIELTGATEDVRAVIACDGPAQATTSAIIQAFSPVLD